MDVLLGRENVIDASLDKVALTAGGKHEESHRKQASLMDALLVSELGGSDCPVMLYQEMPAIICSNESCAYVCYSNGLVLA